MRESTDKEPSIPLGEWKASGSIWRGVQSLGGWEKSSGTISCCCVYMETLLRTDENANFRMDSSVPLKTSSTRIL